MHTWASHLHGLYRYACCIPGWAALHEVCRYGSCCHTLIPTPYIRTSIIHPCRYPFALAHLLPVSLLFVPRLHTAVPAGSQNARQTRQNARQWAKVRHHATALWLARRTAHIESSRIPGPCRSIIHRLQQNPTVPNPFTLSQLPRFSTVLRFPFASNHYVQNCAKPRKTLQN